MGSQNLGVAKYVSRYTLAVSLSVKLAPGILKSFILQKVYLSS